MTDAEDWKVLLIASNFPPVRGGSAVVYDNMARAAGGRVEVLGSRLSYLDGTAQIGWREHDRRAPYRVRRLALLRTILPSGASGRWARLRLMASDLSIRVQLLGTVLGLAMTRRYRAVCVGELLASGWIIRLLRRLTNLRVIVYVHGEEITTRDTYDPQKRRCRAFLQAASGIVVVSRFTQAAVLELLGPEAASRVRLIENGVASRRFTPGEKRGDLVERYGLDGCFVFVSVCRLLAKKGVDHALQAFAELCREPSADGVENRFLVVGTGPYEAELQALAQRLGIAGQVVFAGAVAEEDLVDMYRLGDAFVMPNRELPNGDTEGFGLVFLEANACGQHRRQPGRGAGRGERAGGGWRLDRADHPGDAAAARRCRAARGAARTRAGDGPPGRLDPADRHLPGVLRRRGWLISAALISGAPSAARRPAGWSRR